MIEDQPKVRDSLLEAALWFVQSAARLSRIRCIALIGSIVSDRPSPKDIDLVVYVADDADLAPLASTARRLQGRLQSQNRGADVFLADERRHYLGRTCSWKVCRPGVRASCDALHCGRRPYLHDDLATIRLPDSLVAAPLLELWPVVVRRCEVPADVEQMVSRLQQPHNPAVERTVGSHSFAAAAHRERWASRQGNVRKRVSMTGVNMRRFSIAIALVGGMWFIAPVPIAEAAPCLMVTLTGTQGGPSVFKGQAGAGTLVRYGDDSNDCGAVKLQFDTGRGTNMRLSQIDVSPVSLNAIFFTHMHGDHTEGFADIMMLRWYLKGPKIDIVCSSDAASVLGFTNSCRKYVTHFADAFLQSGEIAERRSEDKARLAGGPADLANVITFDPKDEPQIVWSSGDVKVSAVRSTHTVGHASYRVDTPAGNVVIGGDAANDKLAPPRASSTSDQVERLAQGVDIIVHSTIHPVLGPDRASGFPPPSFYRQSLTIDLGAMAKRVGAKYLMLTHLAPSLGAVIHNRWKVPGGPLTEADYRKAVEAGGFTGTTIVGTDLATLRLPAK